MNIAQRSDKADAAQPQPIMNAWQQHFEPLLNDKQAARLLGNMPPRTLHRLARAQAVPAIKIGRFWFFRASALNAWVDVKCGHRPCFSQEIE
jgi:hypothetical protein